MYDLGNNSPDRARHARHMTRPWYRRWFFEPDHFGEEFLKDVVHLAPRSPRWGKHQIDRPRIHLCGFWGECKSYGAPPCIGLMGCGHHWMLWLPSRRNTNRFHFRHEKRDRRYE